jgi:hypothetical protein
MKDLMKWPMENVFSKNRGNGSMGVDEKQVSSAYMGTVRSKLERGNDVVVSNS